MLIPSQGKKKKVISTVLALGILSVGIFLARETKPVIFFQGLVQSVFSIPKSIMYSLGKKESDAKVLLLTQKNRELTAQMTDYHLLKRDNEALKSQFELVGETSQSMVAAKIIGFHGDGRLPSELIINAGLGQNLKQGMTVVFGKYFVGKIEKVSSNYSVVMTPFSPAFKVLAKLPETNAAGVMLGRGDFMLFDGVIITDNLKNGGVIVTKGEVDINGIGITPDMILGKIISISKNETAPFQSAQVMPLIEYPKLTDVFVVSQM